MEFELRHPDNPTQTARVGHDPVRAGVFVEVTWNGVTVAFDQADLDDDDAITGVVRLLATWGFIDPVVVSDLRAYLDTPSCWRSKTQRRRVRRVLEIVEALEAAGH